MPPFLFVFFQLDAFVTFLEGTLPLKGDPLRFKTGEVMGWSLVEVSYLGAEAVREACKIAVDNLMLK